MLSVTEENYIKQIVVFSLEDKLHAGIGTNELAARLFVKPSSVNVMLKRLKERGFIRI